MEDFELLIDLHKDGHRQGPGGDAETERALDLTMIDRSAPLKIVDIGCGTGASTILLARLLPNVRITAVDFLQDFLDVLARRAASAGVADRISPLGYFVLPHRCWLDEYYRPIQARCTDFLDRNGNSEEAREVVAAEQREIDLYDKYKTHYSYGVYVARKQG